MGESGSSKKDSLKGGEPSAGMASAAGQRSMMSQSIISLSFRSQSSTDSYDTIFEPRSTNARPSEASQIDQPDTNITTHSSTPNKNQQPHSGGTSSCHVSKVTHETMLLSPRQYPPLQVMDRSAAANDVDKTSSPVYTPNNTPQKWSAASTESLFSLHEGRISSILMSNRPSLAAGPETARTDDKGKEQAEADPSISENTLPDVKIPNHIDANVGVPEISSNPRRNNGKIQPLPTSVNKKHEKPSSCCKRLSCCFCSCKSLSCTCCCPSLGSCCSKPKCSCCKMPSCSCSCCSLKWCCNWNCCSKKSCCSVFNCCSKWNCSCTCPKIGSCCPSCKSCRNVICCWNWSCWKLLCSWNCNCCGKTSCWRNWSCGCKGSSCCKSWNCFSKGSCWNCCSKGTCCLSWNCCCKGTCCSSWKCSCCKSWKC